MPSENLPPDFRRLFAALPASILVLRPDAPRFTIVTASDVLLKAAHTSLEAVVGRGIFEAFPYPVTAEQDGPAVLRASLERVLATGQPDRMPIVRYDLPAPEGGFQPHYWLPVNSGLLGADGKIEYILHRSDEATDFVRLARGEPVAAGAPLEMRLRNLEDELLQHTQQLRRSNEKLAQREAELSAVFNQAPLFQAIFATDGTLLRCNDLAFDACGHRREQEIGRQIWHCAWWSPDPAAQAFVEQAIRRAAAGETVSWRADYFWANAVRRTGDFNFSPVREAGGRVILIYATGRDCTEEQQLQDALAVSERSFRSLVSNVSGMVYRVQAAPPWKLLYISEGVESLSGYPPAYFLEEGHSWASLVLAEDVGRIDAELAAQAAAGLPMRVEYRIRRRDGRLRWLEGRVRIVEGDSGLFEGTAFDIDERKRAEEALRETQEDRRNIMQAVPGMLWTARPDGTVEFISQSSEMVAPPIEERLDSGWLDFLHPDDVEPTRARWQSSVRSGEPYETRFRRRDRLGEYHWVQSRAHCRRDERGNILRWYGLSTSVDELVNAQAQLADSERRLRAMIGAAPGLIWTATADGAVDFVSDAARAMFGVEPAKVTRDGWQSLIQADHRERVVAAWGQASASLEPYQIEVPMAAAGGGYRWIGVRASAERDAQGRVTRWFGSAADIDDVKRAQARAEEAARAKSAFLSAMSHEIRTPLNAVLGFAALLADSKLVAQQRDFVSSIRASGDHLLGVINDILDFSKLESGGVSLNREVCELHGIVESALDLVASQAASRNLELLYQIDDGVPMSCIADGARLRQVLVNLLGNAVKFTPAGEVSVQVSARPLDDARHEFEFSVRDTGIGIPAERLGRLFHDFSQIDDSIARRFGGTGLGLAISKRLVEAHGGSIDVQSEVGTGSCFRFRIPAGLPAAATTVATPTADALRGRRVLLVDDADSAVGILAAQLRRWGLQVMGLRDPAQAVAAVRAAADSGGAFELALVDQHMPVIDGIELARRLRAISGVPMILLASLGTTFDQVRALGADFAAVQSKPMHRSALFESICAVLAPLASVAPVRPSAAVPAPPPMRLLLAEDNAINRRVAQLLLRKLGYEGFDVAADGEEALAAVRDGAYDVVLMDVQMPNLDGLGATRRIRAELPPTRQPQIIAMTANAMTEDRAACLAAGMDDYVAKPIELPQLSAALQRAAERRGIPSRQSPSPASQRVVDTSVPRSRLIAEQVLAGGGEMGALMRRLDWSRTALGPVHTWPQSLRTAVSIVLMQKHPMFLWWGAELVQFYNDAYRPILGRDKHPAAIGQRGRECWTEVWDSIGPLIEAAMQRGESSMVERGLLCLFRNGYHEEGYYSYGYSPIRDESGEVGGILVACSENTADVIGTRRQALLLELAQRAPAALDNDEFWSRAQTILQAAPRDLPFALVYAVDAEAGRARLLLRAGLPAESRWSGQDVAAADSAWPLFRVAREHRAMRLDAIEGLPVLAPWPEAPHRARLLPLAGHCVLVAGLSPRLPFDPEYDRFLDRIAAQLSLYSLSSSLPQSPA